MSPLLPRTFADVAERDRLLTMPEVIALLDCLPDELKSVLVADYRAGSLSRGRQIRDYFARHSAVSKEIVARAGSALAFEFLYKRIAPTEIDRYYLDCSAGRAIHARLTALETQIPKWLEVASNNGETLVIDNVGSGTGRDMIRVLDFNASLRRRSRVRNIDPDKAALAAGRQLAESKRVAECISYVPLALQAVAPIGAHLTLLVGVLCPLSLSAAKHVLRAVHKLARPGGFIIYSTAVHKMLEDDPFTDFLMRLHGWEMSFKTATESLKLVDGTGWTYVDSFSDMPFGHHCMVVAQREGGT